MTTQAMFLLLATTKMQLRLQIHQKMVKRKLWVTLKSSKIAEDKKIKGLMLSAIVAKSSEVAEKIICEPKSLENWKKINGVETKKKSKKKKSSCVDVKEPEAKSVSKTVLNEKAKELKKEGIKLNKREEIKAIKKLAHWDNYQKEVEDNKALLQQFPKVCPPSFHGEK